jgi:hypothetical protein
MGCYTTNTAETFCTVTGQFQRWDLRLPGRTYSHADHLPASVDVGTHRLIDFCANCCQTLGKIRRGDAIAWYALVIQPL